MEFKLYVGNLSYTTSEEDLQSLFEQAGTVKSEALIKDRDSGRSKRYAFVEMSSQEEAHKAMGLFNGTQLQERAITVSIARPREETGGRGGGGRDRRYGGGYSGGGQGRKSGGNRGRVW